MRKPRDFDSELKALADKAKKLKERRVLQLGELVIATGADATDAEILAGALLDIAETSPAAQTNPKVQRALLRNPALLARIEASRKSYSTVAGAEKFVWQPEIDRVHAVVLKNARGHAYFEYGEPRCRSSRSRRAWWQIAPPKNVPSSSSVR